MSVLNKAWNWGKTAVKTVARGVGSVLSPGTIEQIKKDTLDYTTVKTNETLKKIGLGEAVRLQPVYYDQYKPVLFIGAGLLLLFLLFRK